MIGSTGSRSSSSSSSFCCCAVLFPITWSDPLTLFAESLPSPAHRSQPASHPNKRREEDNRDQKIYSILRAPCSVAMATVLCSYCYADSLVVVGISVCTAFLYEGISWLFIYHTSTYKSLRSSINKTSNKLESMKSTSSSSTSDAVEAPASTSDAVEAPASSSEKPSSRGKKMDRVETSLKESTRDLSFSKFKSGIVVAAVLFVIFGLLNSLFEGQVVAKLPFSAMPLVLKMSH